ncbi:MAG: alpha/beta hydrolase [Candidatus Wildermuthbacteria bacterium]|nr:alpha/beta hydrolase [Candidatus Wildermuthbacteria bacterium]
MDEEFVEIRNCSVRYLTAGNGQPVLVLHGWSHSADDWQKVQELLALKGFRMVVPDFPGRGKTSTLKEPWGIGEYCAFVEDFAEKLGLRGFFLVGHSFGGRIAVRFARVNPSLLKGLVLVAPAGIRPEPDTKTALFIMAAHFGNALLSLPLLSFLKAGAKRLALFFIRKRDYAKANPVMREVMKKTLAEDAQEEIKELRGAVRLIWGEEDKTVPLSVGLKWKEMLPHATLTILPGIGHSPNKQAPAHLAEVISEYMRSCL